MRLWRASYSLQHLLLVEPLHSDQSQFCLSDPPPFCASYRVESRTTFGWNSPSFFVLYWHHPLVSVMRSAVVIEIWQAEVLWVCVYGQLCVHVRAGDCGTTFTSVVVPWWNHTYAYFQHLFSWLLIVNWIMFTWVRWGSDNTIWYCAASMPSTRLQYVFK